MLSEMLKGAMGAVAALADKAVSLLEAPVEMVIRRKLTDKEKKGARAVIIVGLAVVYVAFDFLAAAPVA